MAVLLKTCLAAALLSLPTHAMGGRGSGGEPLRLSFGSYASTPVVITHFGLETPASEMPSYMTASGMSDREWPRTHSANLISTPPDAGRDGLWRLEMQWVELPTDRAWRASIEIPYEKLRQPDTYQLQVITGPNGLLLIGSDLSAPDRSGLRDIVRSCGERVPSADHAWRNEDGYLPGLSYIMKDLPPVRDPECPARD